MRYHKIHKADMVNGEGIRVSVFLSGCTHCCKGCYNQSTWNPNSGELFTQEIEDSIIQELSKPYITGLTVTGGDPLHKRNLEGVLKLLSRVPEGKDVWLWSGYYLREIQTGIGLEFDMRREIISKVNVFVDGRFEESLKDLNLAWRGSSNQTVHRLR